MTRRTPLEPWIAQKISADRLTRSMLEEYQLRKVREMLALIREKSLFYRKHLAQAPDEIDDLKTLERFPFTTADDIRQLPYEFLSVSQSEINRVVTLNTSGTTGAPKRIFQTSDDQELTRDFFQIGMSTFVSPGERVLILLPGERSGSVGDLLAEGLARLGAVGLKQGPVRDVAEVGQRLQQEAIDCIVGVPTHVLALAQALPAFHLKSVLLTTDHVPDAIKHTVEQNWGCTVYNHYGMTEMGLGGGVDCAAQRGYHLREADLYIEIIDPQTGRQVNDGEEGEIVLTTLTRRGMPLLRYRTGDVSRFIPELCPCGTVLKTLAHVKRRIDSLGLPLALSDLDEALFAVDGVTQFAAGLTGKHLHLQIECSKDVFHAVLEQALNTIPAIRSGQIILSLDTQRGHSLLYAQQMKKRILEIVNG